MAYVLRDWQLISHIGNNDEPWHSVTGKVYGRPGWKEGKRLYSSEIKSVEMKEGMISIQTLNSIYECAEDEHTYSRKDSGALKELLGEAARQRILEAVQEKGEERRQFLLSKLPADTNKALIFVMSDAERFYFESALIVKDGVAEIVADYHVHVGMIQDSVLIGDMDHFDFRFFPYKGNRLKYYAWDESYEPIYVSNNGVECIEVDCPYGAFLIKPGCLEILEKDNSEAMTQEHITPAIDKYTVWEASVDEDGTVSYT